MLWQHQRMDTSRPDHIHYADLPFKVVLNMQILATFTVKSAKASLHNTLLRLVGSLTGTIQGGRHQPG